MNEEEIVIEQETYQAKQQLRALHQFKIKNLCNAYTSIRMKWIRQRGCACVDAWNHEDVFDCIHIQSLLKDKYKKEEKKLWTLTANIFATSD